MYPHIPYLAEPKTYYYFRPYNWFHIPRQQAEVLNYGADPRNPYANEVFKNIYEGLEIPIVAEQPARPAEAVPPPRLNLPALPEEPNVPAPPKPRDESAAKIPADEAARIESIDDNAWKKRAENAAPRESSRKPAIQFLVDDDAAGETAQKATVTLIDDDDETASQPVENPTTKKLSPNTSSRKSASDDDAAVQPVEKPTTKKLSQSTSSRKSASETPIKPVFRARAKGTPKYEASNPVEAASEISTEEPAEKSE